MDSNRSLTKKLVGSESKQGKGNRCLFDSEQLTILNTSFSEDPYPDFATRRELANLVRCSIDVISNWFQNKRARLPAKERRKILEARKSKNNALQNSSLQATTRETFYCVSEQSISYTQGTVLDGNPSVDTPGDPSQQ
ncbi:PREDICTED: double homeobox protein A-like, partial [Chrysochloris asiatica]|uniref:Double homeobox protein A-like n=1 Tax=Chrysochloris asiatica TaxID=185453 RepID=A0A9B0T9N6_CHRAS